MSFAMDTTDEIESGESTYLNEAGTYHCVITDVLEGQGPKGGQIDGFTVELAVLAGTTSGQKDKQTNLCLFSPDPNKDESARKWAKRKQQAFAIAACLIDPAKLGSRVSVELGDARGRQVIVSLEKDKEGKFLQLSYDNIYHVDDPRAAKFPKDKEALALIPKELKKPASYFEPLNKKDDGKKSESRLSKDELNDL